MRSTWIRSRSRLFFIEGEQVLEDIGYSEKGRRFSEEEYGEPIRTLADLAKEDNIGLSVRDSTRRLPGKRLRRAGRRLLLFLFQRPVPGFRQTASVVA